MRLTVCSLTVALFTFVAAPVFAEQPAVPSTPALQPTGDSPASAELSASSPLLAKGGTTTGRSRNQPAGSGRASSTNRILTEAGFGLLTGVGGLMTGALLGGGITAATYPPEPENDGALNRRSATIFAWSFLGGTAGFTASVPVAVHLAGRASGEDGKLGKAFAGSGIGLASGLLTGALTVGVTSAFGAGDIGGIIGVPMLAAGPLVGAIIGWENSRSAADSSASAPDPSRRTARWQLTPFFGGPEQTGPGVGLSVQF